jgi:hypothetical protein
VCLFILSVLGGIHSVLFVAHAPYEKILIGISWGALVLTAIDIIATTDVRKENDKKD